MNNFDPYSNHRLLEILRINQIFFYTSIKYFGLTLNKIVEVKKLCVALLEETGLSNENFRLGLSRSIRSKKVEG